MEKSTRIATIKIKEKNITIIDVEFHYENGEIYTPEGVIKYNVFSRFGIGEHKVKIINGKQIIIL